MERTLGVTKALARSIRETRQTGKVVHRLLDLVRQRVFGIACGYADCNDAVRLREDPMQKTLLGRDPLMGRPLADPSTLSRFENRVGVRDLVRMGHQLAELVIDRHRKLPQLAQGRGRKGGRKLRRESSSGRGMPRRGRLRAGPEGTVGFAPNRGQDGVRRLIAVRGGVGRKRQAQRTSVRAT